MEKWLLSANDRALKNGLKGVNIIPKLVDYWMSDECCVMTSPEQEKEVKDMMYEMFMEFKAVYDLIDTGKVTEINLKLAVETAYW